MINGQKNSNVHDVTKQRQNICGTLCVGFVRQEYFTGWTAYVIHPGIFYRKLYNGGNLSTI